MPVQGEPGLDVLVHGGPERDDIVRYFAERRTRLPGFPATRHGWAQSYGTRQRARWSWPAASRALSR